MKQFENKKRIVIKVGSSTLAYPTGHLNLRKCQHLIEVMSDIKNSGREVVFVTSGAQGVSGGTIAFLLGFYDSFINSQIGRASCRERV